MLTVLIIAVLTLLLAVVLLAVVIAGVDRLDKRAHDREAYQAGYRSAQSYDRPDLAAEIGRTEKYAADKNLNPYSRGYLQGMRDRQAAS